MRPFVPQKRSNVRPFVPQKRFVVCAHKLNRHTNNKSYAINTATAHFTMMDAHYECRFLDQLQRRMTTPPTLHMVDQYLIICPANSNLLCAPDGCVDEMKWIDGQCTDVEESLIGYVEWMADCWVADYNLRILNDDDPRRITAARNLLDAFVTVCETVAWRGAIFVRHRVVITQRNKRSDRVHYTSD